MNRISAIIAITAVIIASQVMAHAGEPWILGGVEAGEEVLGPNGVKMMWVPEGEFTMGSADGKADEQPVHRVQITKGFWISETAITIAQWRRYCVASKTPLRQHILAPTDDHPMSGLNWDDVDKYCRFYGLTMPTEAQWEYAARGPKGSKYPWGNQWSPALCCCDENRDPSGFTCPAGKYLKGASWCGALDMAGNLSTWCADWYDKTYYARSPAADPAGPEKGTERVQRGGYCWGDADECRSAKRFSSEPANEDGSGSARPCFVP